MKLDELGPEWRTMNATAATQSERDQLIASTCRRIELFWGKIFRRDMIETFAAIFVTVFFVCVLIGSQHLVVRIGAGILVCWALFIIWKLNRTRTIQPPAPVDAPVQEFCRIELDRLDRQIHLLRSVLWWYIAPCMVGVNIVFVGTLIEPVGAGFGIFELVCVSLIYGLFTVLLGWWIYNLNIQAVKKQLMPARDQLAGFLNQLEEGGSGLMPAGTSLDCTPNRRSLSSVIVLIVALVLLVTTAVLFALSEKEYEKRAPFTGVRWEGETPVVKVDEEWVTLVSIDGVAAEKIVEFSQNTYGNKWRKRFAEDLVEVLTRMGHEPGTTVRLVVRPPDSTESKTLEDVPMTEENRRILYNADGDRDDDDRATPFGQRVSDLRAEKKLVGLAALMMADGEIVASAADGERKKGSGVRVSIDDQWHLGSITKSMTATLIARLIDSGKMTWHDTVGDSFPNAAVHDDWKPVTLRQLLTHTAGAPANFPLKVRKLQPALGAECVEARRKAVMDVISQQPVHPPGTKFAYSNVGYAIAGAMAEQATGESWSELMKREVFAPLELNSAGFGPPKSPSGSLDQPRGHRLFLGRKVAMSDTADNTPIMGPAGTVHMTLADLCRFATEHLGGENGSSTFLNTKTWQRLHTPELDNYACGWVKKESSEEIPYPLYWHNGSNTMWYALVVFIPEKNAVIAVSSNDGDLQSAESAAWAIVAAGTKRLTSDGEAEQRQPPSSEAAVR